MASNQDHEIAELKRELEATKVKYQQFAYIVSHDLTAPLRSIEGFSELILSRNGDSFDPKTKEFFGYVTDSANEMKTMLSDLLAHSRLMSRPFEFSEIDLKDTCENAIKRIENDSEQSIECIEATNLPTVVGDREKLEEVFFHVLRNAHMYRVPDRDPEIRIESKQTESHWVIEVSDNGMGIPDRLNDRVFQPFRRTVNPKNYPGAGMGLANAEQILSRHRGKIWFNSIEQVGSTFCFSIAKDLAAEHGSS